MSEGSVAELTFSIGVDFSVLETSLKSAEGAIQELVSQANTLLQTFDSLRAIIEGTTVVMQQWNDVVQAGTDAIEKQHQILNDSKTTIKDLYDSTKDIVTNFESLNRTTVDLSSSVDTLSVGIEGVETSTKRTVHPVADLTSQWKEANAELLQLSKLYINGSISEARYEQELLRVRESVNASISPLQLYNAALIEIAEASQYMSSADIDKAVEDARKQFAGSYSAAKDYGEMIGQLKTLYDNNVISLSEYTDRVQDAGRSLGLVNTPLEVYLNNIRKLDEALLEGVITQQQYDDAVQAANKSYAGVYSAVDTYIEKKKELDQQLASGLISDANYAAQLLDSKKALGVIVSAADEYRVKLNELSEALSRNVISQAEYDEAVQAAKESYGGVYSAATSYLEKRKELDQQLADGVISEANYASQVLESKRSLGVIISTADEYRVKLNELNEALSQNAMSQAEYDEALLTLNSVLDESVAKVSAFISVPLLGFLVGNVYAAADFEKTLKSIQATFADLTSTIGEVGNNTGLDAVVIMAGRLAMQSGAGMDDVVAGMTALGEAGLSVTNSLAVMNSVMQVAVTGSMELDSAAAELTEAYVSLGLRLDETAGKLQTNFVYLTNQYAVAAKLSAGSVVSFVQAVSSGAGEATKVLTGLMGDLQAAVNNTMAALVVYSQVGFGRGQKAGEAFKQAVQELTKSINEHREAWLNIVGFNPIDDLTGSYKSLTSIVDALAVRFGHLQGEMLKVTLAQVGVSVAGARVLAPLIQNAALMEEYRKQLALGEDAIGELSEQMGNGLYVELNRIKSAVQTCAITLGNDLLPYVTSVTAGVRHIISAFSELSPSTRVVVTGFAALVGGTFAAISGFAALRLSTKWVISELKLLVIVAKSVIIPLRALSFITFAPLVKGIMLLVASFRVLRLTAISSWATVLLPVAIIGAGIVLLIAQLRVLQAIFKSNFSMNDLYKSIMKVSAVIKAVVFNFSNSMKIIYQYFDELSKGKLGEFVVTFQMVFKNIMDGVITMGKVCFKSIITVIDSILYGFDWVMSKITGGVEPVFGKYSRVFDIVIRSANELGDRILAGAEAVKVQNAALVQSKTLLDSVKQAVDDEVTLQSEAANEVRNMTEQFIKQRRTLGMASEQVSIWELEYKLIGDAESRLKGYKQRLDDLQKVREKYSDRDTALLSDVERQTLDNLNVSIKMTENTIEALTARTSENRAEMDKLRASWLMLRASTMGQEMKQAVFETQKQVYALIKSERAALDLQMRMYGVNEATRLAKLQAYDLERSLSGEKSGRDELRSLREQAVALGMNADNAKLFNLELQGVSKATIEQIYQMQKLNAHFSVLEQYAQEADALVEQFSDQRKLRNYEQMLKKYEDMLAAGMIDAQTYARATADAYKNIQDELHIRVTLDGLDDFDATSAKFKKRISEMSANRNIKIVMPKKADNVLLAEVEMTKKAVAEIEQLRKKAVNIRLQATRSTGNVRDTLISQAEAIEVTMKNKQSAIDTRAKDKEALRTRTGSIYARAATERTGVLDSASTRRERADNISKSIIPDRGKLQEQFLVTLQQYTTAREQGTVTAENIEKLRTEYEKQVQIAGTPQKDLDVIKERIVVQEQILQQQKEQEKVAKKNLGEVQAQWAATGDTTGIAMHTAALREDEIIKQFDENAMKPLVGVLDKYADNVTNLVKSQQDLELATKELSSIMLNSPEYNQYKSVQDEQERAEKELQKAESVLSEKQEQLGIVEKQVGEVYKKSGTTYALDRYESLKAAKEQQNEQNKPIFQALEVYKREIVEKQQQPLEEVVKNARKTFLGEMGREAYSDDEALAFSAHREGKKEFENMYKKQYSAVEGKETYKHGTVTIFEKQAALDKSIKQAEIIASKVSPDAINAKKALENAKQQATEAQNQVETAKSKVSEIQERVEVAKSKIDPAFLAQTNNAEKKVNELNINRSNLVAKVPDVFNGATPTDLTKPATDAVNQVVNQTVGTIKPLFEQVAIQDKQFDSVKGQTEQIVTSVIESQNQVANQTVVPVVEQVTNQVKQIESAKGQAEQGVSPVIELNEQIVNQTIDMIKPLFEQVTSQDKQFENAKKQTEQVVDQVVVPVEQVKPVTDAVNVVNQAVVPVVEQVANQDKQFENAKGQMEQIVSPVIELNEQITKQAVVSVEQVKPVTDAVNVVNQAVVPVEQVVNQVKQFENVEKQAKQIVSPVIELNEQVTKRAVDTIKPVVGQVANQDEQFENVEKQVERVTKQAVGTIRPVNDRVESIREVESIRRETFDNLSFSLQQGPQLQLQSMQPLLGSKIVSSQLDNKVDLMILEQLKIIARNTSSTIIVDSVSL
jgi:TP901 family phage tail tape measure protein